MSCDIRKYKNLSLTALIEKNSKSIQFTIGNNYTVLNSEELCDLIEVIKARLICLDGFTATGNEREDIEFKGSYK